MFHRIPYFKNITNVLSNTLSEISLKVFKLIFLLNWDTTS